MKLTTKTLAVLAGASLATLAATSPKAQGGRELASVTDELRATGLTGWELVDAATQRVHQAFEHESLWSLWESAPTAMSHGHGWSAQYNGALALVLERLGFDVHVVHAARVTGLGHNPWWHAGHSWLRVTHDGRTLDVCAGKADNRAGRVAFMPVSEVRPMRRWTRGLVSVAMAPVVTRQVLLQLAGAPQARWLYRPFGQDV